MVVRKNSKNCLQKVFFKSKNFTSDSSSEDSTVGEGVGVVGAGVGVDVVLEDVGEGVGVNVESRLTSLESRSKLAKSAPITTATCAKQQTGSTNI